VGGAPTRFAIRNRQAGRAAGAGGREGRLGAGLSLGGGARVWGICPDLGGGWIGAAGEVAGQLCLLRCLDALSSFSDEWAAAAAAAAAAARVLCAALLLLLLACCCCGWVRARVRACVGGRKRGERTMLCYAWEEETRQQHESLLPLAAGSGGLTDLLLRLPLLTERERDRETQPVDYLQN
jgi:hypothetical protein